jgi:hypothetical protein
LHIKVPEQKQQLPLELPEDELLLEEELEDVLEDELELLLEEELEDELELEVCKPPLLEDPLEDEEEMHAGIV